jgi:hypothetical protein
MMVEETWRRKAIHLMEAKKQGDREEGSGTRYSL